MRVTNALRRFITLQASVSGMAEPHAPAYLVQAWLIPFRYSTSQGHRSQRVVKEIPKRLSPTLYPSVICRYPSDPPACCDKSEAAPALCCVATLTKVPSCRSVRPGSGRCVRPDGALLHEHSRISPEVKAVVWKTRPAGGQMCPRGRRLDSASYTTAGYNLRQPSAHGRPSTVPMSDTGRWFRDHAKS